MLVPSSPASVNSVLSCIFLGIHVGLAWKGRTWSVLPLDLRNHGKSAQQAFPPPHTVASAAADIVALVQQQFDSRGPNVIMGHSLGGKVVLAYLRQLAAQHSPSIQLPNQVWAANWQQAAHGWCIFFDIAACPRSQILWPYLPYAAAGAPPQLHLPESAAPVSHQSVRLDAHRSG